MTPTTPAYQPLYCEENIWHLGQTPELRVGSRVLTISSSNRSVAMWSQRAGRSSDGLVVWDYHVVLLVDGQVWDLDCRAGFPLPLRDWAALSFPLGDEVPAEFRPLFRHMTHAAYVETLSSDRSHMRTEGGWRAPPPPWPPIQRPGVLNNVLALADMSDRSLGTVMDLPTLLAGE